jgi:flavodoxin I
MWAKCTVVYTSISGNTEKMAEAIADGIRATGCEVDVKDMFFAKANELAEYDGLLLGSCTWGDGELPDEALYFYEELDELNLQGKKAAAFGSCDSNYDSYGAAVDLLEEKLRDRGAEIVVDKLKVELLPTDEDTQSCREYGRAFAGMLSKQSTVRA